MSDLHPTIAALRRDHEKFLREAQHLRHLVEGSASSSPLAEGIEAFLIFWRDLGDTHIREEEEILFPLYLRFVPTARDTIDSLKTDHTWLRDKVDELASLPRYENTSPVMRSLYQYIASHVKREEDAIYDNVLSALDEDTLDELAKASADFRQQHRDNDNAG